MRTRSVHACAPPWASTLAGGRPNPPRCPSSAQSLQRSVAERAGPSAKHPRATGSPRLQELLPLIAILAASGLVAGFAAGLLGVGGGIVTVPVLEYSLRFAGVPEEYRMHVAVATSLAA